MIISFLVGLLIGVIYFGGLFYSTQKFNDVKSPAIFMILSFAIRSGVLISGLYYLAKTGYESILVGFVAIMLVRFTMVLTIKKHPSKSVIERE